jgi:TruD family tRNA pseudouridine synthase
MTDYELWQGEQQTLAGWQQLKPELFRMPPHDNNRLLPGLGITAYERGLPRGLIKYSPLDFIVEEIRPDGEVVRVDEEATVGTAFGSVVFADMTKVGLSTLDAAHRLAEALNIPVEQVGWAGVKDMEAVTAQRISLQEVSAEQVAQLRVPAILLNNIHAGNEPMPIGSLSGNRFTLLIRTRPDAGLTQDWLEERVAQVGRSGVLNFFGPQRFNWPRPLAHEFGKKLLRGDWKGTVRGVLTLDCPYEPTYAAALRYQASGQYGNWQAMLETFQALPFTFRTEISMLEAMLATPGESQYEAAIRAVPLQAKYWAQAYGSRLTNLVLSEYGNSGTTPPEQIPLTLTHNKKSWDTYRKWLVKDGTAKYIANLKPLEFIRIAKSPRIPAVVHPVFHAYQVVPQGVILSFDLPKGAYATTALMSFFDLLTGPPTPDWINRETIDTKTILGDGSLGAINDQLHSHILETTEALNRVGEAA